MRRKLKLSNSSKPEEIYSNRKWAVMEKSILNHGVQWEALTSSKVKKISEWISQ